MSFNDFIHKYNLKKRATSNTKIQHINSSLALSDLKIFLEDGSFTYVVGIVSLHQPNGTLWVAFINRNYCDSYYCSTPQKLSRFIIKRNGHCLFSEYKIQPLVSFCAAYCFHA